VARTYRYISGDSHLEIDSKHWIDRVPAKYRDQAPRLVGQADGSDAWKIGENIVRPAAAADLYGGKGRDEYVPFGGRYEGTPGTGTPEQRIKEQDQDGIDAEVLFPSQQGGPKFWRRIEDDAAYKAVVHAYNSWLAEEYSAVDPSRLIGVGILPLTHDVADTIEEMEQCLTAGLKTVLLQGFPSGKAYPSKEDDPFWAAALDLKMPVSVHVDLDRTGDRARPLFKYPQEPDELMKNLSQDLVYQVGRFGPVRGNGSVAAVQWVLSGLFDRFPNLRIFFAENQIGWIPFFLQAADVRYDRHVRWAERLLGFKPLIRSTLRGFIDIELGIGLQITEASLHVSHGKAWVGLPSKPVLDADGRHLVQNGKKQYRAILAWRNKRLSDAFSRAVVALVIERHPGALDDGGVP